MPLRHCYCVDCENERVGGSRNRPPRRTEEVRDMGPESSAPDAPHMMIHPSCDMCGRRNDRCQCIPCGGCGSLGRNHGCRHGGCGGFTCNGSCDCGMRAMLNYSAVPPMVRYRRMGEDGTPSVAELLLETRQGKYPPPPDEAPYLGLELETEVPGGDQNEVAGIWWDSGNGWGTSDGSLGHGVECKTFPSTYGFLAVSNLEETLAEMVRAGARAWGHESTGLHTHVSRKAFTSRAHEYVFTWLQVNRFRDQCLQLAGRQNAGYATWPAAKLEKRPNLRPRFTPQPVYLPTGRPTCVADLTPAERQAYDRNAAASALPRDRREGNYPDDFLWDHFETMRRAARGRAARIQRNAPRLDPDGDNGDQRRHPLLEIAKRGALSHGRGAVAVTPATLELRYWKGTLCGPSVMGQCAFIDSLIKFSAGLKVNVKTKEDITWDAFGAWCADNLGAMQAHHVAQLCKTRAVPFAINAPGGTETASAA